MLPRSASFSLLPCLLLAGWLAGAAQAQQQKEPFNAGGIYKCTDSRGRTITSDRPIADCLDREQRELNPSGTTRRVVEPSYTAREQAEREEKQRQAALVAARAQEERRRDRALLIRFPTPASHDRERADALGQIDAVLGAARKRVNELADDRRKLDDEMEFYKKDPSKAPASLRRQVEDNQQSMSVQTRFIGEQEDEKRRVNQRFDDERIRLKQLWSPEAAKAAQ